MALSKIFNEIILETALAELFDFNKIVPYDFQQIGNDSYKFLVRDGILCTVFLENVTVNKEIIEFSPLLKNVKEVINASFDLNGVDTQYSKENLSEFLKILLTVKICVNDYVDKHKPECVVVVPMSKLGLGNSDKQKDMIYRSIWKKYPISGYGVSDVKIKNFNAFCLYNIDKIKNIRDARSI